MNAESKNNAKYMILKAFKDGKSIFLDVADEEAVETFRNEHENKDLFVSTCLYSAPDPSAERTYPLYFYLASNNLEKTCVSTLEAYYYISENFNNPEDCLEPCYDGDATMLIIVPPVVFDSWPTPFMPAVNYHLCHQLIKDGIQHLDQDSYEKNHFLPLPNSINSDTGRFIIPLAIKELMYLDARSIIELSKQPKPENSFISPQSVPQAAEWFAKQHEKAEKEHHQQNQLQKILFEKGWQISPCIRRLLWAELDKNSSLEACRLVARFYSFIKAGEAEIWQHLHRLDKRHGINDYQRLKAIVTFAVENPDVFDCSHPLLWRFCTGGKCFIAGLTKEFENPYLFEQR